MQLRDIDFAALRDLRGRFGAAYPRGRVLFHEGDTSTELYVVLQGSVDMAARDPLTGEPKTIRTVAAGELFGEMACFCGRPRRTSAVVREDAVLLRLPQTSVNELLGRSSRFALGVIQTLCDRIEADTESVAAARAATVPGV